MNKYNRMYEKIAREINTERLIEIAKGLISNRSDNFGKQEYDVAVYAKGLIEQAGLDVHLQHVEKERYNVIGTLKGKGTGKTLMYIGHTDVVPAGDESGWLYPPYQPTLVGDRLYGRGAVDMKGSIASMIHTLEVMKELNIKLDGDLLIVLDADEEINNKGIYAFFESGLTADCCIVGEPTDMKVVIGHKGILGLWVTLYGKKAHAAAPEVGINPIRHAVKLIEKIDTYQETVLNKRVSKTLGRPTMTVTMVNSGQELNSVPDRCDLRIDRRLVTGETKETAMNEAKALLEELKVEIPDFNYSMKETTFCPYGEISEDHPLVDIVKKALNSDDPHSVKTSIMVGTCEASLIMERLGVPSLVIGPGEISLAHMQNEYICASQLEDASNVFARIIIEYLGADVL